MKNNIILLSIVGLLCSCDPGNPNQIAEFYVDDVSKEQTFIDSITGTHFNLLGGHVAVEASIEGELDSSASVSFHYYPSTSEAKTLFFKKGESRQINSGEIPYFKTRFDFYADTLLIRYIPKGATKGHLKISTNIL